MKQFFQRTVACCLTLILILTLAAPALAATQKPKKAIYILPGYAESRLFDTTGLEIWAGLGIVPDLLLDALGKQPQMAHNADGTGMKAAVDRNQDLYGTLLAFKPMIDSIKSSLKANHLDDQYDVVFFSYNWLGDLNATSKELEDSIAKNGYEKVILLTHSNGGLLASTFISSSSANKAKVERAILIAAPLYGTYTSLEPLETGGMTLFDGTLFMGLLQLGYSTLIHPISRHWVKSWAVNSPNTYQLLPSQEYLSKVPAIYKPTPLQTEYINDITALYKLINQSANVNPNLSNGNARSHKYLRTTVFKNDVLAQWQSLDAPVTLIGCNNGFVTPYTPVYRKIGTNKVAYSGMIYTKKGDSLVAGVSMDGDGKLDYINFDNAGHITIVVDPRVLEAVNQLILGQKPTGSNKPAATMLDMVRIVLKSSLDIRTTIFDQAGKQVAIAFGDVYQGFTADKFAFENLPGDSEYPTNVLLYLPKTGYRVEFTAENVAAALLTNNKTNVVVSTLDDVGFNSAQTEYALTGAALTGHIVAFDNVKGANPLLQPSKYKTLASSLTQTYPTAWAFDKETVTLDKAATDTINLIGADAQSGKVKAANLLWASSNTAVVTVTTAGKITAKAVGTADITAIAKDDSFKAVTCRVTVTQPVTGVKLSATTAKLEAGQTAALTATISPDAATDKTVKWTSSDAAIATVDAAGVVTGKKAGTATITVTTNNGAKTAACKVTVTQPVTGVTLTPATATVVKGKTQALTATVLPADATDKTVKWSSSDTAIATVSTSGVVTGKKAGTAVITVTTVNGAKTAVSQITVQ